MLELRPNQNQVYHASLDFSRSVGSKAADATRLDKGNQPFHPLHQGNYLSKIWGLTMIYA